MTLRLPVDVKSVKISHEKPPIWEEAKKAFDFDENITVFTYGDTVYNPGYAKIEDHLMAHEMTHCKQQNWNDDDARIWWDQYINNPTFRLEQEIEAYGNQYKEICRVIQGKNQRWRYLMQLAGMLSGPMYGNVIGIIEASRRIKLSSGIDKN